MSVTNRGRVWASWLGIVAIAGSAGLAMGWRADDPPPPPPPREHDGAMFDRDAMSARMQRRIEEMERELARMKDLKQRLDKGEAPPPEMDRLRPENAKKGELTPRERMREAMERRRGEDRGPGGPPQGGKEGGWGDRFDYETLRPKMLENAPGVVEVMDRLRERNRPVADRVWQRMMPHLKEASALRERDPVGYGLKAEEVRTGLLVILAIGDIREAKEKNDDAGVTQKRAALRDAVSKQIDARIATQRHEVEALDQRLASLRKNLDAQVQDREKTIDERTKRMEEAPEATMGEGEKPSRPKPQKK